ncbi:MAG TPA: hypothetical protein VEB40_05990 [Flavipsychrobacter sp.]|nr:hypothetical protein [Flavipsychrobacter sp.]
MENKLQIEVTKVTALDSIPAGSGLLLEKDSLYIISDNSPSLFKLNLKSNTYREITINGMDKSQYELPKRTKPDFESSLRLKIKDRNYLLAFGSGSAPRREVLLMLEIGKEHVQKRIPLNRLYAELRKRHGLSDEALNIEGAAGCHGRIYLLLRKKNMVVSMEEKDFIDYLEAPLEKSVPASSEQIITLPRHGGVFAGFSGATEIRYKGKEAILFCASLEHTPNAIDDGPVSGSYVGLLTEQHGKLDLGEINFVRDQRGNILNDKIESLVVSEGDSGSYKAILVADNDNGRSKLLEVVILIKN